MQNLDGWNAEADAAVLLNDVGIETEKHEKLMKDLEPREKVKVLLSTSFVWKSRYTSY